MLIKLYLWLSLFVMWGMIFSYHTLISIFFFFFLVLIISTLLIILRIEFVAYLLLLIYLGGILVFFLFSGMLFSTNFNSIYNSKRLPLYKNNNIFFFLIILKLGIALFTLYAKLNLIFFSLAFNYLPSVFDGDFECSRFLYYNGESYVFTVLYGDKGFLLIIISMVLFATIYGVLILCTNRRC